MEVTKVEIVFKLYLEVSCYHGNLLHHNNEPNLFSMHMTGHLFGTIIVALSSDQPHFGPKCKYWELIENFVSHN